MGSNQLRGVTISKGNHVYPEFVLRETLGGDAEATQATSERWVVVSDGVTKGGGSTGREAWRWQGQPGAGLGRGWAAVGRARGEEGEGAAEQRLGGSGGRVEASGGAAAKTAQSNCFRGGSSIDQYWRAMTNA